MGFREDVLAAVDTILGAEPDGLTAEALARRVGPGVGRQLPPGQVIGLLNTLPQRFYVGGDDRWRLRVRPEIETGGEEEAESTRIGTTLRPGCYVVFDLEALGQDVRNPETEIIQIAAQRWIDGLPEEPWVTLVRPASGLVPAHIAKLTNISSEDVGNAPGVEEALAAFFAYAGDLPLIAHNGAASDGPLIEATCLRLNVPLPKSFLVLDTLPLARALLPWLESHRVTSLAEHYGCAREGAHQADVDVAMLADIIAHLQGEIRESVTGAAFHALLRRAGDPWAQVLEPPELLVLSDKVTAALGANITPALPDRAPPAGALDLEAVRAAFERAEMEGRQRRPAQIELAEVAAETFASEGFAAIEAGTGTGKSLGYLVPAALQARVTGRPVAISTYTRLLQAQLVDRELPFVQRLVPGLTYTMLQGRSNYLSLPRLAEEVEDALSEERITRAQAWILGTLVRFAERSEYGNLEALGYIPRSLDEFLGSEGAVLQIVSSVRSSVDDHRVPGLPDFYRRARESTERADLVVVNHALLFNAALRRGGETEEPFASQVVCDEAHTLEDAATLALEASVDEQVVQRLLRAVHDPARRTGLTAACRRTFGLASNDPLLRDIAGTVGDVRDALDSLADRLYRYVATQTVVSKKELERYGVRVRIEDGALSAAGGPALRAAAQSMGVALGALREAVDRLFDAISVDVHSPYPDRETRRKRRVMRLTRSLLQDLYEVERTFTWFWSFAEGNRFVRVVELGKTSGADSERPPIGIHGVPINVGPMLWGRVWSRLESVICTSATLTVFGQGFDFFLGRVGLERERVEAAGRQLVTHELPHAFDYPNNALLMLPNNLPAPRDSDLKRNFPEAVAELLQRFIPFFDGRSLVLFTANARRDAVYESVSPSLAQQGYEVLSQGHGSLPQLIESFRDDYASSLLGSRSLWEGVDVPGESLQYVFLEKLPYPSLGDPVEAARMAALAAAGRDSFYEYMLPKMVILLKQGFGRLIRGPQDRGAAILLDKRLRNAMYRMEALRSLPGPTVGYESDTDMFRRIADWMDLQYDPDDLPQPTVSDLARVLLAQELAGVFVPAEDFATVALPRLVAVQEAIWGQSTFRPQQVEIMQAVLAGKDVLTLLPTGAGKSRTYQLPALIRPGLTLVVSPLIALIRDQVEKLREVPGMTHVASLVSGMDAGSQEDVLRNAAAGRLKLLYVSPERLRDPRFQAYLPQLPIVQLVVDEAHCICTWGHDFRPDFLEIPQLLTGENEDKTLPVHALTATATKPVQDEIYRRLKMGTGRKEAMTIAGDFVRANLVFRVYSVAKRKERDAMTVGIVHQLVSNQERGGAGIVYVATRKGAEQLTRLLLDRNIAAQAYHGGMETPMRHQVQERFMQGDLDVVVATTAFGMGVDKSDIRFVLHYDHPGSLESYAQEAGRAGRDGQEAFAILLSHSQSQRTLRFIAKNGMPQQSVLEDYHHVLTTAGAAVESAFWLPDGTFVCDPDDLANLAQIEPTQARVLLYSFQEAGLIRRGDDCTLEATILLNGEPHAILSSIEDAAQRDLVAAVFAETGATPDRQAKYYAAGFVVRTGLDPRGVDAALTRLAERDLLLYRPYKRGATLVLESSFERRSNLEAIEQRFNARYQAFEGRLQAMLDYIHLPPGGARCRSAYLVNYLTGDDDTSPCGKCDLCSPTSQHLPFDPSVFMYGEPLQIDPYLAILGAVRDHNGRFGVWTIEKMLLGTPSITFQGRQRDLAPTARASDHFGDLEGTGADSAVVRTAVDTLLREEHLALEDVRLSNGNTFSAVTITQKGLDALVGGLDLPVAPQLEVAVP